VSELTIMNFVEGF